MSSQFSVQKQRLEYVICLYNFSVRKQMFITTEQSIRVSIKHSSTLQKWVFLKGHM